MVKIRFVESRLQHAISINIKTRRLSLTLNFSIDYGGCVGRLLDLFANKNNKARQSRSIAAI